MEITGRAGAGVGQRHRRQPPDEVAPARRPRLWSLVRSWTVLSLHKRLDASRREWVPASRKRPELPKVILELLRQRATSGVPGSPAWERMVEIRVVGADHALLARVGGCETGHDGVMSRSSPLGATSCRKGRVALPSAAIGARCRSGRCEWPKHVVLSTGPMDGTAPTATGRPGIRATFARVVWSKTCHSNRVSHSTCVTSRPPSVVPLSGRSM